MSNLYIAKIRVYEPSSKFVKFKPALTTSLVGAKTKAEAETKSMNGIRELVRKKFPAAEVKLVSIKQVRYSYFFQ